MADDCTDIIKLFKKIDMNTKMQPPHHANFELWNNINNKVYLLKRLYWQSHSKALYNKTFYAKRYKENIIDLENQSEKDVSSEET